MKSLDAGISVKMSSAPRSENNWMARNPLGVNISYGSSSQLSHNVIADGQDEIRFEGGHATLTSNVLERQIRHAFSFSYSRVLQFYKNNILDNSGYSVYLGGCMSDVDATGNWWGPRELRKIEKRLEKRGKVPER